MTRCFTAGDSLGVLAMSVAISSSAIFGEAHASPWGCQVALCPATPGSPTFNTACVEPITKRRRVLAAGGHFPVCEAAGHRLQAIWRWACHSADQCRWLAARLLVGTRYCGRP